MKLGNNGSYENGYGGIDSVDVVGKEFEFDLVKGEKCLEGLVFFFWFFIYVDFLDCFLIVIGVLVVVVYGLFMFIFLFFLGDLIDGFGVNISNFKRIVEDVDKYVVYMVYFGIVVWFVLWVEVVVWM